MGVDATDYDGDGWQDLFVANIDQVLFSLYHNQKDLTFTDNPGEIAPATRLLSGWGLRFFDYDNDGDPDLILANGHPDDMVEIQSLKVKYKEPLLMFENVKGTYKNVSSVSGVVFAKDFPARGLSRSHQLRGCSVVGACASLITTTMAIPISFWRMVIPTTWSRSSR